MDRHHAILMADVLRFQHITGRIVHVDDQVHISKKTHFGQIPHYRGLPRSEKKRLIFIDGPSISEAKRYTLGSKCVKFNNEKEFDKALQMKLEWEKAHG